MAAIEPPLIVIVGPTASGKTSLAIKLAKQFNGEIISADSRAIYKGMDIGTAKPNEREQAGVVHFGLDLVEPGQYFSVADFKKYADQKINEIRLRGHTPFLVGGSGLYIDAVVFDYRFGPKAQNETRSKLQHMTVEELSDYIKANGIKPPDNFKNKRYLIRAIETKGVNVSKREKPLENTIIVGITTDKEELRSRITTRAEQLFEDGVVDEAKMLGDNYGWDNEAMKSNIYPFVRQYLAGELTYDEMKTRFMISDWHLAKRQLTWMRRNKYIDWRSLSEAKKYLVQRLAECTQS